MMLSAWSGRDPGPLLFGAKRQVESPLMQNGLRYTIVRPATGSGGSLPTR